MMHVVHVEVMVQVVQVVTAFQTVVWYLMNVMFVMVQVLVVV